FHQGGSASAPCFGTGGDPWGAGSSAIFSPSHDGCGNDGSGTHLRISIGRPCSGEVPACWPEHGCARGHAQSVRVGTARTDENTSWNLPFPTAPGRATLPGTGTTRSSGVAYYAGSHDDLT